MIMSRVAGTIALRYIKGNSGAEVEVVSAPGGRVGGAIVKPLEVNECCEPS